MKEARFGELQIASIGGVAVMAWRPFEANAGEGHWGGKHVIGHVTQVLRGAVEIVVQKESRGVFHAPCSIEMPAGDDHDLIAQEDGTCWICCFVIPPDFTGNPVSLTMEV